MLVEWTRARIANGAGAQALEPARRAAQLYPESGLVLGALGEAQLAAGDSAAARATLARAVANDRDTEPRAQQRASRLLGQLRGAR